MKKFIGFAAIIILASCNKQKSTDVQENLAIVPDSTEVVTNDSIVINKEDVKKNLNQEILESLKSKNYAHFSEFIHPKKGIIFSMYSYLEPNDKHFSKTEFKNYFSTNTKFTWGEKDGTGDLLVLPIKKYIEEWAFTKDFTKSAYFLNEFKGSGNSINNIKKTFPNSDFTENYIAGTEEFGEMDWSSLILVFEKLNDTYYLVAVVNNSWTL